MTISNFARIPLLMTLLAVAVFGSASRSHAGIIYGTGNQQGTNVNLPTSSAQTTITGTVNNTGIDVTFNGFDNLNNALLLDSKSGGATISANDKNANFSSITFTAEAGFAFTAGDFNLSTKSKDAGNLYFFAYDANNNLITPTGTNTFAWVNGSGIFNFNTDAGSLVSSFKIVSDLDMEDFKSLSVNAQSIQSVPEPTSTLAFAGVAAMCGLYRLRRRNRKTEK